MSCVPLCLHHRLRKKCFNQGRNLLVLTPWTRTVRLQTVRDSASLYSLAQNMHRGQRIFFSSFTSFNILQLFLLQIVTMKMKTNGKTRKLLVGETKQQDCPTHKMYALMKIYTRKPCRIPCRTHTKHVECQQNVNNYSTTRHCGPPKNLTHIDWAVLTSWGLSCSQETEAWPATHPWWHVRSHAGWRHNGT